MGRGTERFRCFLQSSRDHCMAPTPDLEDARYTGVVSLLMQQRPIGGLLVERGWISGGRLEEALDYQRRFGGRIGSILVNMGALTERQLILVLADQLECEILGEPADHAFSPATLPPLRAEFLLQHDAVPVAVADDRVLVAVRDPLDFELVSAVERETGKRFVALLAPERELRSLKERLEAMTVAGDRLHIVGQGDVDRLRELASEAPVIRLVNAVIARGVEAGASDIHFESVRGNLRVRFRIDGALQVVDQVPAELQSAVLTRLKLIAGLDIAESRLPQDGRIEVTMAGRDLDLRVSSVPTGFGESIALRLLDKEDVRYELDHLGFTDRQLDCLRKIIDRPNGIFLVTGPTGSGKTTTLYSALNVLNSEDTKIMTVEDPVEYQLDGINQLQVKSDVGYTFARALRALLRQDPDVIMVGEIRDEETARIAVQAALTGHRVFSTLHTSSALGALVRLRDMGVEDYLLRSALAGVMAQRLVRPLCLQCRRTRSLDGAGALAEEIVGLARKLAYRDAVLWEPVGCEACRFTGFSGRTTIAEVLPFDEDVAHRLDQGGGTIDILALGHDDMRRDGLMKALRGLTSLAEVLRVT